MYIDVINVYLPQHVSSSHIGKNKIPPCHWPLKGFKTFRPILQ